MEDKYQEFVSDLQEAVGVISVENQFHKIKTRRRCKICNKFWCSKCYYRQRKLICKICNKIGCVNCMIEKNICKRCFHK